MSDDAYPIDLFLQPGEYFVGNADYRIRTLLGSCVSITLWHAERRIGAMSHFLLSARGPHAACVLDGRYGDEAFALMLKELRRAGVDPGRCVGKIFGGGDMFPGLSSQQAFQVGRRNGEAARQLLQRNGVRVVSESLFGVGYRQIVFDVASGDVWARQVKPQKAAA